MIKRIKRAFGKKATLRGSTAISSDWSGTPKCAAGVIMGDGLVLTLNGEPKPYPPSVRFTGNVQH